jgi:hypothetical protein
MWCAALREQLLLKEQTHMVEQFISMHEQGVSSMLQHVGSLQCYPYRYQPTMSASALALDSALYVLCRLSDGFSAAAAAAGGTEAVDDAKQCGSAFLQRQPADLHIHQVAQLQEQYRHLLLRSAA